jgi:hypothetical protein
VQFLLFLEYLKVKKMGRAWNGGWITDKARISQIWTTYTIIYLGDIYTITPDGAVDITDIILSHLHF